MSTIVVANVHLEPTGNNRIHFDGVNVTIFQSNTVLLGVNTTSLSVGNNTTKQIVPLVPPGQAIGTYVFSSNATTLANCVNASAIINSASSQWATLYPVLQNNQPDFGVIWNQRTHANASLANSIQSITWGNNQFVMVGGNSVSTGNAGMIQTSPDGLTWTNRSVSGAGANCLLLGVAYGNDKYVAVGASNNSNLATSSGVILSSTDAVTWTYVQAVTGSNSYPQSVAYGNGVYVATTKQANSLGNYAGNGVWTSTDSTTWTRRTSANNYAGFSIAYGNGVFVSVGSNGTIQSSTNGTSWTQQTSPISSNLYSVAYGNGVFLAVGYTNYSARSTNGTTWTSTGFYSYLSAVTYANGYFYALGTSGVAYRTTDGNTWDYMGSNLLGVLSNTASYAVAGIAYSPTLNMLASVGTIASTPYVLTTLASTEIYVPTLPYAYVTNTVFSRFYGRNNKIAQYTGWNTSNAIPTTDIMTNTYIYVRSS